MKTLSIALVGSAIFLSGIDTADAHPRHRHHVHTHHVVVQREVVVRPAPVRTALTRVVGAVFDTLPDNHVRVVHRDQTYYFHDGYYYKRDGRRYVIVKPIRGVRIVSLPNGYTRIRVNGETLYSFREVNYRRIDGVYVVV